MAEQEKVVVRLAHIHNNHTFVGMGRGETRGAAEEAAIQDLLTVLPASCRRPLIRLRSANESQDAPWELLVRLS